MSVELRPLGVTCNIGCEYCYQQPQRDAGNLTRGYDLEAMKAAIEREGGPFTLFGGEPLLVPIDDLEALWAWGLGRFGSNSLQTNGTLITDAHIDLFRRYRVQVGISLDGPGALNDARSAGTLERTRAATERAQRAVERLCREGLSPSIIVTLHRGNATRDRLPALHAWVRDLRTLGVIAMRLHLLEVEDDEVRRAYALTDQENVDALVSFGQVEPQLLPLRLDVFDEMRQLLLGADDRASCVWHACDPYTTRAVQGVEGSGQRSNCGRTQKDGVDFVKADEAGFERYLALYQTPQASGGCQGCRFFLMCKGQCPGTAIDRDWRNRTEHCEIWKALFGHLEQQLVGEGKTPLSVHPSRSAVEARFLERWAAGESASMSAVIAGMNQAGARGETPS